MIQRVKKPQNRPRLRVLGRIHPDINMRVCGQFDLGDGPKLYDGHYAIGNQLYCRTYKNGRAYDTYVGTVTA